MVVSARWLSAKYTNRQRLQASTAQNTDSDPISPQSITSASPGDQTPGRRPRWFDWRHRFFSSATRRRKLRSDPE
jgi:hypothetical protein